MRLAVMICATAALAACGDKPAAGPERRSAAREVLGGEVTDDMLPLDTVRSTSPPGLSGPSEAPDANAPRPAGARSPGDRPAPKPEPSAAPTPDVTAPADPAPARTDGA